MILRYTYSLYLSFEPGSFLREGHLLLVAVALFGALGGWLDRPDRALHSSARMARALLLTLVFVALFQVFRQSLATSLPLPGWAKAGAMLGCAIAAIIIAWRMRAESAARLCNAACLAMVTLFALQPGMPGYLMGTFSPQARDSVSAAAAGPAARRTVVIVFDEWDMEISEREGLFQREAMQGFLRQSFFAQNALPAGPNTLESIPGMLFGRPFGEIDLGGKASLRSKSGEVWGPQTPQLFSDLKARNISHAVVGYYHDYCALITTARTCHAEPVQFFQGWKAQFERVFKRSGQFDFPYSVFLQQWHATYNRLHDEALKAVEDRANAVIWIHINVPHPPSAMAQRAPRDLRQDYRANLELTAELIEAVRQRLAAQGEESTLVLTSDHWLRERELWSTMYEQQRGPGSGHVGKTADQRVPLIVWFSGSRPAIRHQSPISLLAARNLVLGLTEGGLRSPQDVARFFEQQPAPVPPRSGGAGIH
ncbi:MAG: sulfatase-like hydrolase/transferase [Roseateles sp.]